MVRAWSQYYLVLPLFEMLIIINCLFLQWKISQLSKHKQACFQLTASVCCPVVECRGGHQTCWDATCSALFSPAHSEPNVRTPATAPEDERGPIFCLWWAIGPPATPKGTAKSELLPSVQLCSTAHLCKALFLGSRSIGFDIWWAIGITSTMAIEGTQIHQLPSHEGLQGGGVCTNSFLLL